MPRKPARPPTPPASLEQYATAQQTARYAENQEIARSNRAMRAALEQKDRDLATLQKRLGVYELLDDAVLTPPSWLAPAKSVKEHHAIPTMLLTDIHWDEVVDPAEIDHVNKYDRAIAERRVKRAFDQAVTVPRDYLGGVTYDGFQLFLGGDLMSGIIHEELRETNQGTVIESILSVVEPLIAGVTLLAATYGKVHIAAVVGNHGRRTQKPVAKHRPQDNFDWLVYKMMQREFRGRADITMDVSNAADAHVTVYQTRYLLTHGDQFKGGSGISGALAPLLLGTHRKTRRQANAGQPFDVMVMGHFHTSLWMPTKGLIVGGSVIGYNEYAYQNNLEVEAPQCAFWLTAPRGITVSAPLFVQDRRAEGW